MTDPQHDLTEQMLNIAAEAEREAEAQEAAEAARAAMEEMREMARTTRAYLGVLRDEGISDDLAREIAIDFNNAYWHESMRRAFRQARG